MKTDSKLKLLVSAMVILAFTVPILFWFILNPETFWEKLAMLIVHVIISISLGLYCRKSLRERQPKKINIFFKRICTYQFIKTNKPDLNCE